MSPAIRRARNWPRCIAGRGRASPCRCMANCATWPNMPGWPNRCRCPKRWCPPNGQLYRLAPGPAELIDEVPSGRIHLDGRVLVAEGEGLAKARRAMAYAGLIAITLVLDGKGRAAADPAILIEGIPEPVHEAIRAAVERLLRRHKHKADAEELARKCPPRRAPGRTGCLGQEARHPCYGGGA